MSSYTKNPTIDCISPYIRAKVASMRTINSVFDCPGGSFKLTQSVRECSAGGAFISRYFVTDTYFGYGNISGSATKKIMAFVEGKNMKTKGINVESMGKRHGNLPASATLLPFQKNLNFNINF